MSLAPQPKPATQFGSAHPRPLGDKYLLLEEIARGGMGAVHLAMARGLAGGSVCAIKTVAYQGLHADDAFLSERFMQEARAIATLRHENLVYVFDSGLVARELYLAMEFIEGKTLAEIMAKSRAQGQVLPLGLSMWIALELLNALTYVHGQNFIHRDVTPSNVMISSSGSLKLLDFGLARPKTSEHQTGMVLKLGKPGYVAPEQFWGLPIDARADLFSVAVIFWELLTGQSWLAAGEVRRRDLPYVPPSTHQQDVPSELDQLLMIALAEDPDNRFQTATEFANSLARYLAPSDYRKKARLFLEDNFGSELAKERMHREQLISGAGAVPVSSEHAEVGPIARLEDYVGVVLGGRYEVKRLVAKGAMGAVFEGWHKGIERKVAIKVPFFKGNPDLQARFVREARATNRINDSHVVVVTDAGETPQGDAYVVMEYLEGESLDDVLKKRGRLDPEEAVAIACQMARAMEAAHNAGVIHRDIKPANVMLIPGRDGVHVKVLDFGVARYLDQANEALPIDGLTRPEMALGTPRYMAPEQITTGATVDGRADVYAAATVLFEMLSGHVPFEEGSPDDVCLAKVTKEARGLLEVAPQVSAPLCALVMSGLARDPALRVSSSSLWRSQLESLRPERRRNTEPVSIARSPKPRLWVGVLTLFAGAAGIFWSLARHEVRVSTPNKVIPPEPVPTQIHNTWQPPVIQADASQEALKQPEVPVHVPPVKSRPKPLLPEKTPSGDKAPLGATPNAPPEQAWDAPLTKAKLDFTQGRFFDSLIAAKKAARLGAGLPAFLLMGRANLELEEDEEAAAAFRSALVLDPGNADAQRGLKRATGN